MNRTLATSPSSSVLVEDAMETDALEVLLAEPSPNGKHDWLSRITGTSLPGVVVGTLVDVSENGELSVRLADDDNEIRRPARGVVPVDRQRIGAEVVLAFENGNRERPIILGLLSPTDAMAATNALPLQVTVDDDRLELSANREIVLRCGEASITLTQAGKIIIRGAYVLSRSSGVNRIKGGSVQIN